MRESLQRPLTKVGLLLGWHALFSKPRTRRFSAAGIGLNTITAVCLCGMTLAAWSAATNAPITGPWLQHLHPNSRCWQRPFCFKGLVRTAMQGSTWDLASMSTRMMQPADRGGRTWAASQTVAGSRTANKRFPHSCSSRQHLPIRMLVFQLELSSVKSKRHELLSKLCTHVLPRGTSRSGRSGQPASAGCVAAAHELWTAGDVCFMKHAAMRLQSQRKTYG